MKVLFLLVLVAASLNLKAQCTNCASLEEALKSPEGVVSLKVNGTLTGIKLDSLPRSVGLLVNVGVVYMSDHNIKAVPKEIGNLKKLKILSFAGCQLEDLPEELFTLSNLKEVILLDNAFSEDTRKALEEKIRKRLPGTKVFF